LVVVVVVVVDVVVDVAVDVEEQQLNRRRRSKRKRSKRKKKTSIKQTNMTLPTPLIPMPTLNPNATPFDQIFGLAHIDAQSSRKGGDVLQFHHRLTFAHVVLAALERYFEFEAAAGGRATTVVVATVVVATVVVAMHQCLQHLLRHRPTRQDGVRPRKRLNCISQWVYK